MNLMPIRHSAEDNILAFPFKIMLKAKIHMQIHRNIKLK